VPIGILGILLATRFIPDIRADERERFDIVGMVLAGLGIGGLAFGLSVLGLNYLPWFVVAALIVGGACFIGAYLAHARRTSNPVLDLTLFRVPTFFAGVVGGFMFRLGIGALSFLLPLMLQIGFGMTPFHSGLITFATALGSLTMKGAITTILRRFGFRTILVGNALVSSAFLAVCAAFTQTTPVVVMFVLLMIGGFFRSLQFTSINTIAYAEVDAAHVGRATVLVSVGQQLAISSGVALGALAVEINLHVHGSTQLQASDFPPAFLALALVSGLSALLFARLNAEAGAEMTSRRAAPSQPPDDGAG
jgi:hypothetical protein